MYLRYLCAKSAQTLHQEVKAPSRCYISFHAQQNSATLSTLSRTLRKSTHTTGRLTHDLREKQDRVMCQRSHMKVGSNAMGSIAHTECEDIEPLLLHFFSTTQENGSSFAHRCRIHLIVILLSSESRLTLRSRFPLRAKARAITTPSSISQSNDELWLSP
jgi:hypothetical protein